MNYHMQLLINLPWFLCIIFCIESPRSKWILETISTYYVVSISVIYDASVLVCIYIYIYLPLSYMIKPASIIFFLFNQIIELKGVLLSFFSLMFLHFVFTYTVKSTESSVFTIENNVEGCVHGKWSNENLWRIWLYIRMQAIRYCFAW